MQDPKSRHLRTITQLRWSISSQLRHVSTVGKKLVKQQYLHVSHNMANFGPLAAEDRSASLGHLCKFQRVRILATLLHGTLVVSVSQTLWCWTEGATYIRQGGHHVGHWFTFLVLLSFFFSWSVLSSYWLDVYHTSTHDVALVQI